MHWDQPGYANWFWHSVGAPRPSYRSVLWIGARRQDRVPDLLAGEVGRFNDWMTRGSVMHPLPQNRHQVDLFFLGASPSVTLGAASNHHAVCGGRCLPCKRLRIAKENQKPTITQQGLSISLNKRFQQRGSRVSGKNQLMSKTEQEPRNTILGVRPWEK